MKVGPPADPSKVTNSPPSGGAAPAPAKKDAASTAVGTSRSSGVAVTVSTAVRQLEQASRGESSSEVNMDKVNAVKSAMADGTYVVDPGAIADKLLSNAQEMLNQPRA